jgi:hypothetical protein
LLDSIITFYKKHHVRIIIAIIVLSIAWSLYVWISYGSLYEKLGQVSGLGAIMFMSELAFTVGAIIMLVSLGEDFPWRKIHLWPSHVMRARRDLKLFANEAIQSKLFGFGFWLNFVGAVLTSLILFGGILVLLPVQAWGLLVIVIIDLLATFGWRVPLHIKRRNARDVQN